jgi:hypothetical protein
MKKYIMSDRVKLMAIRFNLIFGLLMIVAWAAKAWFVVADGHQNLAGIPLFFTVAISVGGGILMGLIYFSSCPARHASIYVSPDHRMVK